ncbi:MAG: hypothetical protein GY797_00885 [Deltaproteobacteria bacterium]|nr:hypothetical protein [Deltaproteobacteria bacterium]
MVVLVKKKLNAIDTENWSLAAVLGREKRMVSPRIFDHENPALQRCNNS